MKTQLCYFWWKRGKSPKLEPRVRAIIGRYQPMAKCLESVMTEQSLKSLIKVYPLVQQSLLKLQISQLNWQNAQPKNFRRKKNKKVRILSSLRKLFKKLKLAYPKTINLSIPKKKLNNLKPSKISNSKIPLYLIYLDPYLLCLKSQRWVSLAIYLVKNPTHIYRRSTKVSKTFNKLPSTRTTRTRSLVSKKKKNYPKMNLNRG